MPKSIYVISGMLLCLAIVNLLSRNIGQFVFTAILFCGVLLKIREIYILLKAYGHFFILFLGYAIYSHYSKTGLSKFSLQIGSININPEIAMYMLLALLSTYIYFLYREETEVFFRRTLTPKSIAKYLNGNIIASYLAFLIVAVTAFEAFSIKYKMVETKTYLSSLQVSLSLVKMHYKLSPEKYNNFVKGVLSTDEQLISHFSDVSFESKELLEDIKKRKSEVDQLIGHSEKELEVKNTQ